MRTPHLYKAWCMAGGMLASSSSMGGIVVIVEGKDPANPRFDALMHQAGDQAVANYTAKGYQYTRLTNIGGAHSVADVQAALAQPGVNAFVFLGHGTAGPGRAFTPGLFLGNQVLRPSDLIQFPNVRYVELHACGQRQPAWRGLFPNARFQDWPSVVTSDVVSYSQRVTSPQFIPAKDPPPPPPLPAPPDMRIDARFQQRVMDGTAWNANPDLAPVFFDWTQLGYQLAPPLAALVGATSFNLRCEIEGEFLDLRGLTITDGAVTGDVSPGLVAPAFTMTLHGDAFAVAMGDIDALPQLWDDGRITIEGNVTGLGDAVAFEAAAGAYFGYHAVPGPAPLGAGMVLSLAALRRRRPAREGAAYARP